MYIQIDGAGFVNQGAALMIFSIMESLKKNFSKVKFVMGNGWSVDKSLERRAGLYQIAEFEKVKLKDFSETELENYGLVRRESVSIIIDAGGFQYGDSWLKFYSSKSNKEIKDYYESYKKNGVKIILLPQAFGPFKEKLSQERMKIVHEYADLIYAREASSLNFLTELLGNSTKIKVAPDFTNLLKASPSLDLVDRIKGTIGIIPNNKMMEMNNGDLASQYFPFLENLIRFFLEKNETVFLINHEGRNDQEIINELKSKFDTNESLKILGISYAPSVKAAIGQCKLLISSRYHGAISGISQGVPTFCTSWSHKYQELLNDYELNNNLLDISSVDDSLKKIKTCLKTPKEFIANQKLIDKHKDSSKLMWDEVFDSILAAG